MTRDKNTDEPATRGGWKPAGTAARRRETHAQRGRPHGQQRRATIVAAARDVFEEAGYEVTRIEDIIERAGVSRGTFYTYFESKLDVFREVADAALESIDNVVEARAPDDLGTAARIGWYNALFLEIYANNAKILRLIEHASMLDEHIQRRRLEARQVNVTLIARQIASLQRQGRADPDIDPVIAARLLVSMLSNFAYWAITGGEGFKPDPAAQVATTMWLGSIGFRDEDSSGSAAV